MVLTLLLRVLYGSENMWKLIITPLTDWSSKTEADSVYCLVRNKPLYKTDTFLPRANKS